MDNTTITQIKEAAEQYLKAKQMSRADLARTLTVSETAISQLFNGKYPGDSDKLWIAIARLIGYSLGRQWKVKKTQNLTAIWEMCEDAQESCKFIMLSAETDRGKTTGLQYYQSHKDNVNVYYMLCDVNMQRKEFLNAILRSMGLNTEGSVSIRMDRIVKHLMDSRSKYNGIPPLLILDDAGKLSDHCLRQIQIIYDRTESNNERHAGIIIAGTEYLAKYLNKMADKDKQGFRELRRRIEYNQPLTGVSKEFLLAIAQDYGVNDPAAILYLQQVSTGYGVLKNMLINYSQYVTKHPDSGKSQREILFSLTNKAV